MLDIAPTELIVVALVALVIIGPKDLPKAMRVVGYWVGRARSVTRQFRSGFDAMVREAELAEMEKKWAEENARIMREHPGPTPAPLPAPSDDGGAAHGTASEGPDPENSAVMTEKPMIVDEQDAPAPPAGEDNPPNADAPESDRPAGDKPQ
ncbi:Sec-independent protein translocase protein TatB [Stakelama pacifica]|uniref:Sec-independent protein translocase protein TatB n=1 Tax=Stakelama pacifica TaxID=517720 RepID=A0A4R6FS36_9SPHN|nr:Sec-independent protein translocase protein TatB [Stakelama pacifica]TDN84596.1 sec-independent protein translocase protein TatB [Stakelama pacifica]GGO93341.1 hypothetical protein GCM10011329_12540 [Stakelama pacifica]